jgi:lipid-binding SYLF domain-containing protein
MYLLKKVSLAFVAMLVATMPLHVLADTAEKIDDDVNAGLKSLYASTPVAKELAKNAKGILVFPDVLKAGLIIGGQYGEGALRKGGKTVAYYNTVAASYGLQAGAQTFGYALFLMTDSALEYLENSDGWEVGVGPTIVVVDSGVATSLTTTTANDDIYAVFFDQKGLMAGLGIQGSKISPMTPEK